MNTKLLVPTDFSEVAQSAMQHAIKFAEIINADVILLHVVSSREEVEEAKEKLSKEITLGSSFSSSCNVTSFVRIGNIFEDIGDVAAELGISLIFMGTHKASRWQKLVGSRAIKVITSSPVPFIVTQEKLMNSNGYDNIVVPLDLNVETKQKLELVAKIAHYFDSQVHLLTNDNSDEFIKTKLKANQVWASNYLESKDIKNSSHLVDQADSLTEGIFKLSKEVDADLIAIMNLADETVLGLYENSFQEEIVANDLKVPVLCVNPHPVTKVSGILVR
ncbi:MAG: universal stress protein [Parvicellaceae bacterium]|jgi:nucleotide-binding universal stress UspA family protein|tara:strand:+ start:1796 stop:2623 length:828 start_codon:yes stop_codon:yes gene_type:complete